MQYRDENDFEEELTIVYGRRNVYAKLAEAAVMIRQMWVAQNAGGPLRMRVVCDNRWLAAWAQRLSSRAIRWYDVTGQWWTLSHPAPLADDVNPDGRDIENRVLGGLLWTHEHKGLIRKLHISFERYQPWEEPPISSNNAGNNSSNNNSAFNVQNMPPAAPVALPFHQIPHGTDALHNNTVLDNLHTTDRVGNNSAVYLTTEVRDGRVHALHEHASMQRYLELPRSPYFGTPFTIEDVRRPAAGAVAALAERLNARR